MDPTVRSKLEGIKSQAFALEEYLRSSSNQGTTLNDVAQAAAGYAAKELVRSSGLASVISPRKGDALVKKYLRERDQAKLRDFKKMREAEIDTRLKTLIEQVSSLLKTLSLPRPKMNENGNSQELLRIMGRIYKYSTLERKVKELVTISEFCKSSWLSWLASVSLFSPRKRVMAILRLSLWTQEPIPYFRTIGCSTKRSASEIDQSTHLSPIHSTTSFSNLINE